MARQRPIQHGHIYQRSGSWYVQYSEDVRAADDTLTSKRFTVRLLPRKPGTPIKTKREAQRLAWEQVLSKLNTVSLFPQTLATVEEFWERHFEPEHVATLKQAGKLYYKWTRKKICAAIGHLTMREVAHSHIQTLCSGMIKDGLSPQTARHVRNACSAVFRYAEALGWHHGPNPASRVRLPPVVPKKSRALSWQEASALIDAYPRPVREMAALSILTSMNVAEMLALRVRFVNLTSSPTFTEYGILPSYCLMVVANYFGRVFDTPKTAKRQRIVALSPKLAGMLGELIAANPTQGPEALVFQSQTGGPHDADNLRARVLKPIAEKVIGRTVGWTTFRRSAATFSDVIGMPIPERIALLGHSAAAMTLHYTESDLDRRRPFIAGMETQIFAKGNADGIQPEGPQQDRASAEGVRKLDSPAAGPSDPAEPHMRRPADQG